MSIGKKVNGTSKRGALSRRAVCGGLVSIASVAALPTLSHGATHQKTLSFRHLHTEERLSVSYWRDGQYDAGALADINHVLRDHYSGAVTDMDVPLLDLLCDISHKLGAVNSPFHVISGYRSPETNDMLRKKGRGVGVKSMHLKGKAIDIRIPGVPVADIRRVARAEKRGGVGYYPKSQFVHVDTGRVRFW